MSAEHRGCYKPPVGFICTRERGHDGPCAAHPAVYVPSGYKDENDYLRQRVKDLQTCIKAHQLVIDGKDKAMDDILKCLATVTNEREEARGKARQYKSELDKVKSEASNAAYLSLDNGR